MRIPPTAGPTIEAVWKLSWLRAIAAGRRSRGTRRGIDDEPGGLVNGAEAGRDEPDREQGRHAAATRTARAEEGRGCRRRDRPGSARSSRRRSTTSASDPPPSANRRIGTSWKNVSAADRERRAGQDEDLVRQGDPGDLVADAVDDLAGPQPAVVAVEAKRRGVEEEAADATGRARGEGFVRRPRPRGRPVRRRRTDDDGVAACDRALRSGCHPGGDR